VVIGIQVWDLHLPGCHSLKEKRGTLKPLTAALRQRLNVSVAETGHQDLWQRAEMPARRWGRHGPSWRRPCGPPTAQSRAPTECALWIR
jgi:Uncharacterized protein conserved in bacteria